jgi:hypothetical protein
VNVRQMHGFCKTTVVSNIKWNHWIWGSHSSGYEEFYLLGHYTLQSSDSQPTFQRKISPLSSGTRNNMPSTLCFLLASCWFLAWLSLWHSRRKWYIPPECWLIFTGLYGITSHKRELFIKWNYLKSYSCFAPNFTSNYNKKIILINVNVTNVLINIPIRYTLCFNNL